MMMGHSGPAVAHAAAPKRFVLLRAAWTGWKIVGHAIGNFQSRLILMVLYVVVLAPFACVMRLAGDRRGPGSSFWRERQKQQLSLDDARNQF